MENIKHSNEDDVIVGEDGVFVRNPNLGIVAAISVVNVEGKIKLRFSTGPGAVDNVTLPDDAVKKLKQILNKTKPKA